MEQEKKGSIFGSVVIVLILLGLLIYYLSNKNNMSKTPVNEVQTQTITEQQDSNEVTPATSTDAELEAQVEGLDMNFDDMNAEDLDM